MHYSDSCQTWNGTMHEATEMPEWIFCYAIKHASCKTHSFSSALKIHFRWKIVTALSLKLSRSIAAFIHLEKSNSRGGGTASGRGIESDTEKERENEGHWLKKARLFFSFNYAILPPPQPIPSVHFLNTFSTSISSDILKL